MIKRQPGNEDIVAGEADCARISIKLIKHGLMGERNAFLQTGCAGGMLEQNNICWRALQAGHLVEIRFCRGFELAGK